MLILLLLVLVSPILFVYAYAYYKTYVCGVDCYDHETLERMIYLNDGHNKKMVGGRSYELYETNSWQQANLHWLKQFPKDVLAEYGLEKYGRERTKRELARMERKRKEAKEREKAVQNLERIERQLANESFTSRAPEAIVNAEREKAEKARALIAKLDETAAAMKL